MTLQDAINQGIARVIPLTEGGTGCNPPALTVYIHFTDGEQPKLFKLEDYEVQDCGEHRPHGVWRKYYHMRRRGA